MKAAGFEYSAGTGYLTNVDGLTSAWMGYAYQYADSDAAAFNASIGGPTFDPNMVGILAKTNGWVSIAGYAEAGGADFRIYQITSHRYIFSAYDWGYEEEPNPVLIDGYWNPYSANKERYNFYLYFGAENAKNGWYTGYGANTELGFADAMQTADFEFVIGNNGYIASIDGVDSFWMTYAYIYKDYDSTAATASIGSPVYHDYMFAKSSGWISIAGYDGSTSVNKLGLFDYNTYLISVYDTQENDPVVLADLWSAGMTTAMAPSNVEEYYFFYLYFGEGNYNNDWVVGKGTNAAEAFDDAMDFQEWEYELKSSGYFKSINGVSTSWMTYAMSYTNCDDLSVPASLEYPVHTTDASPFFLKSNGWVSTSGYTKEGVTNKLSQQASHYYMICSYNYSSGDPEPDPVELTADEWYDEYCSPKMAMLMYLVG